MKLIPIFSLVLFLSACGLFKKQKVDAENHRVLYSAYHKEVDGKIEIALVSGDLILCTANILQISCDSHADEMVRLAAVNGKVTLKLLDEKSYYFTPFCNGKTVKLLIQYADKNDYHTIKTLTIKVDKPKT